jgi:hypothetical protein
MRQIPTRGWQLPYLRVSLILRRLDRQTAVIGRRTLGRHADARERERHNLERTRRAIVRAGWFN